LDVGNELLIHVLCRAQIRHLEERRYWFGAIYDRYVTHIWIHLAHSFKTLFALIEKALDISAGNTCTIFSILAAKPQYRDSKMYRSAPNRTIKFKDVQNMP